MIKNPPTNPGSSAGKESACNSGDPSLIPGSGRSPGEVIDYPLQYSWASLGGSIGKEFALYAGDLGLIPGLERSPGEGKGYPLQYSDLENYMDCIVHGVTKSWTRLSDFQFHFSLLLWQHRGHGFWSGKIPHVHRAAKPVCPRALLHSISHGSEKPTHSSWRVASACHSWRKPSCTSEDTAQPTINIKK